MFQKMTKKQDHNEDVFGIADQDKYVVVLDSCFTPVKTSLRNKYVYVFSISNILSRILLQFLLIFCLSPHSTSFFLFFISTLCFKRHSKKLDRGVGAAQDHKLSYEDKVGEFLQQAGLEKYAKAFQEAGVVTVGDLIAAVEMDEERSKRRKLNKVVCKYITC